MAGIQPGAVSAPLRRAWFWTVLLAAAMVAAGLVAIVHPLTATVATLVWIGALFAAAGFAQLLQAWTLRGWGGSLWHIASGMVYLLGGLVMVFDPLSGALAFALVVAGVLLVTGTLRLVAGVMIRPEAGWLSLVLGGAVSVAAGVALVLLPAGPSMLLPGLVVGAALLVEGLALLAMALVARRALRAA